MPKRNYRPRVIDHLLNDHLQAFGAICSIITAPCTTIASPPHIPFPCFSQAGKSPRLQAIHCHANHLASAQIHDTG